MRLQIAKMVRAFILYLRICFVWVRRTIVSHIITIHSFQNLIEKKQILLSLFNLLNVIALQIATNWRVFCVCNQFSIQNDICSLLFYVWLAIRFKRRDYDRIREWRKKEQMFRQITSKLRALIKVNFHMPKHKIEPLNVSMWKGKAPEYFFYLALTLPFTLNTICIPKKNR